MRNRSLPAVGLVLSALLPGCSLYTYTNNELQDTHLPVTKATFDVQPNERGHSPGTLMLLALSGGGSRAAYWSGNVMLALEGVFAHEKINLLHEVDAISSVSGGSLPAAYYAITRDANDQSTEVRSGRVWDAEQVRRLMAKDYIARWFGNWFWPTNIAKFWFTAFDRTDIMAQTFADNLFDEHITGRDLKIGDINPRRPYLILNATNATVGHFGHQFTFTAEDFADISSDINDYDLSRAVMGTATFPAVFNYMTLRNFAADGDKRHFVHIFDGGNYDNLGLVSIVRLLELMHKRGTHYDKLIVILVDAYTAAEGIEDDRTDARRFSDFIVDSNFFDSLDSLLSANRERILATFEGTLTQRADAHYSIFYHIRFEDVADPALRARLNGIKTNFKIGAADQLALDQAVQQLLTRDNTCLQTIKLLLSGGRNPAAQTCHYTPGQ